MTRLLTLFHPIIFTTLLFVLPTLAHLTRHTAQPIISGWDEAMLAVIYFALVSTVMYLARRDYLQSKILRWYLITQYAAVAQFFIVFTIELSIQDSWMLATFAFSLPLGLLMLVASSVSYIIHRTIRARKQGRALHFRDVAGNASILIGLALLVLTGILVGLG